MAETADVLLDDVKDYLNITWQDEKTDKKITGYISRGKARLQQIAGAPLSFDEEGQPRALLLDYCRYANSQALEVFEKNFEAELLDLNLSTQATRIEPLTVRLTRGEGTVSVQVVPAGGPYVVQVGTGLMLPDRLTVCLGDPWTAWDGVSAISAAAGQDVLIVEVNGDCEAERAGKATV